MKKDLAAPLPDGGKKRVTMRSQTGTLGKTNGALRESEERFRKIFESSPIGMALVAPDLRFFLVNPAWVLMTGYSEVELLTLTVKDITHPDYLAGDLEHIRELVAGKIPVYSTEKRYVRKDKSTLWGLLRVTAIRDDNGVFRYLAAQIEDITDRKLAEDVLRNKTALLEAQLNSSLDGTLIVDQDGKKILQNKRTIELWKIPPEIADNPDDKMQVNHVMHMTKNPEQFVKKILYLYDHPDETSHDTVELIDGTILDRYSSPVLGADGTYYGRIWKFRDITEHRKAEIIREDLIAELAQKNAELDRFTYTVSHDLKSPLIGIRAFLTLLEDDIKAGDTPNAARDIKMISESAVKLEVLISTLLSLSRSGRSVSTPLPVSLAEITRTAASLLEGIIREHGVSVVVEENLPVVMGDRERLLQVMTNLLDNGIKFMGDQPQPRVEVGVQQVDGGKVFFVRDNGIGIEKENLSKIFALYERLKPDIPGTGIGLVTVKRIIEAHGGRIWAESDGPGKGTTFRFTLPGINGNAEKP